MGQGRAGSKRKKPVPINQAINQPSDMTQEIPGRTRIVTGKTNSIYSTNSVSDRLINNNNPFMPDVPLYLDLLLRTPKQQTIKQMHRKLTIILILNLILKKTHHFRKVSCQRHSKDWTNHFFKTQKS